MNKKVPSVIKSVVNKNMCIGCGVCISSCSSKALLMQWNDFGFLQPTLVGECDLMGDCISVCPFDPNSGMNIVNKGGLSKEFLVTSKCDDKQLGSYRSLYIGFSREYRTTSSSGGIATYVLSKLLEEKIVDAIFTVRESSTSHYEYSIISNKNELLSSSKTRYYPVTLDDAVKYIKKTEGRFSIVGVACFVRAIRLAQHKDESLKQKIPFIVGIICGGVKSRFYTEYLAGKLDIQADAIYQPQYRIKNIESSAYDYSFAATDSKTNEYKVLRMIPQGDMWGTGLFKAKACDFCDDVTTELADISLGDAWIKPYDSDGNGNNVIVVRTETAEKLILNGLKHDDLVLDAVDKDKVVETQKGSFNHRQKGLRFRRLLYGDIRGCFRNSDEYGTISIQFMAVQFFRLIVRLKSLKFWKKDKNTLHFQNKMRIYLRILEKANYLNHKSVNRR